MKKAKKTASKQTVSMKFKQMVLNFVSKGYTAKDSFELAFEKYNGDIIMTDSMVNYPNSLIHSYRQQIENVAVPIVKPTVKILKPKTKSKSKSKK